jgi:hypothetical protein
MRVRRGLCSKPGVVHVVVARKDIAMSNNDRTLSETDLDLVSGGLRDKPDQDRLNKMIADENNGTGFGGAIGGNLMSGGSHGGQIPVEFNPG